MSSHGIIQPNPALVELGTAGAGARHVLGHEMGLGAACHVCGDTCPGFQVTAHVACTLDCQWGFGKCHSDKARRRPLLTPQYPQYHYWRKLCTHCGCGVADHDIEDEATYTSYFVGRISQR